MKLNILVLLLSPTLILLAGCGQQPSKPNVLVLTLDTLRADALGCYGNTQIQTPNIDRIAEEGVLFEDAICQIPATLTSHTAIMTGRYPKSTGVRFRTHSVPEIEETLAEVYQKAGYNTAAFISSYVLAPSFGLDQGFGRYSMGSIMQDGQRVASERRASEVVDEAMEHFLRHQNEPNFLWLHFFDTHTPYQAPEPYHRMYTQEYEGTINGSVNQITRLSADEGEGLSEEDLKHLEALYWGEVSYLDAQIGRLIEFLQSRGLLENTIIAMLADHGENLGERGHFFHGQTLYQPEVKIPFILWYPAQIAEGQRVDSLVESIDLFPTLLELSEVDEPSALVEGKSLMPFIQKTEFEESPGYLETEHDPLAPSNKIYGLRSETHKFIYNQMHRRDETPLGLSTEIPLKGPSIVMMRLKGDKSIRLMAHIRYRTEALYTSKDLQALAQLPSTAVYAETFGTDALHEEAQSQDAFKPTPEGWRLQATPDLYQLAVDYGEARGWPTQWMVIEGVGVDAALPPVRDQGTFVVDQIELYAPGLRFPENSPRYREPFWVIEDFEGKNAPVFKDSGEGPDHTIQTQWASENVFGGSRQLQVRIEFLEDIAVVDELYNLETDPAESKNLLKEGSESNADMAESSRLLIDTWLQNRPGEPNLMPMDAQQREAMQALGYTQ